MTPSMASASPGFQGRRWPDAFAIHLRRRGPLQELGPGAERRPGPGALIDVVVGALHQNRRRTARHRPGAHARRQPAAESVPAGSDSRRGPGELVVPDGAVGAGVATPTSPTPRPPSGFQPDQWTPSVLWLAHTCPSAPTASTYRVPPTFTAAGPLPASVRPPRLRQGFTVRVVGVVRISSLS